MLSIVGMQLILKMIVHNGLAAIFILISNKFADILEQCIKLMLITLVQSAPHMPINCSHSLTLPTVKFN